MKICSWLWAKVKLKKNEHRFKVFTLQTRPHECRTQIENFLTSGISPLVDISIPAFYRLSLYNRIDFRNLYFETKLGCQQ